MIKIDESHEFDQEYYCLEIASSLMDYQLVLNINKAMLTDFRRGSNLMVFNPITKQSEPFSFFEWYRLDKIPYYLLKQPTLQTSFMLVFYLFIHEEREEMFLSFLDKIAGVDGVLSVDHLFIGEVDELPSYLKNSSYKNRINLIHNILYDLSHYLTQRERTQKQQKQLFLSSIRGSLIHRKF